MGPVLGLAFSSDGRSLYTLSQDSPAEVKTAHAFLNLTSITQSIAEGNTAASIGVWDVSAGGAVVERKATLSAPALVHAGRLALSRDGSELAAGCSGGAIARCASPAGRNCLCCLPTSASARTTRRAGRR